MSAPFSVRDRALCVNDAVSSLTLGRLYYVENIEMTAHGVQSLCLLGEPTPWQACRFERVPDPSPRSWPTPGSGRNEEWFGK